MFRSRISLFFAFPILVGASRAPAERAADPGFDRPLLKSEHAIAPSKEVLDSRAHVTCYEFPTFAVKEVDLAEIGAERLALLPALAKGEKRKCDREDRTGERVLDLSAHYFWGVKGPYAFFRSADGANGFSELEIFEAKTGKKIFSATFYDSFQFTTAKGGAIAIRFSTELTADCSYPKEGKVCWEKMLKNSGVPAGLYAKAPDCPIEINEADGDKLPAAVAAPARVDDLSHPQLKFEKGPLDCRIKQ